MHARSDLQVLYWLFVVGVLNCGSWGLHMMWQDPSRRGAGGMLSPLGITGASGAPQYPSRLGPGPQHFQPVWAPTAFC